MNYGRTSLPICLIFLIVGASFSMGPRIQGEDILIPGDVESSGKNVRLKAYIYRIPETSSFWSKKPPFPLDGSKGKKLMTMSREEAGKFSNTLVKVQEAKLLARPAVVARFDQNAAISVSGSAYNTEILELEFLASEGTGGRTRLMTRFIHTPDGISREGEPVPRPARSHPAKGETIEVAPGESVILLPQPRSTSHPNRKYFLILVDVEVMENGK